MTAGTLMGVRWRSWVNALNVIRTETVKYVWPVRGYWISPRTWPDNWTTQGASTRLPQFLIRRL